MNTIPKAKLDDVQDEYMSFDECVLRIMKVTGQNRRDSTAELKAALRSGKLPGFVEVDGEHKQVPPSRIRREH